MTATLAAQKRRLSPTPPRPLRELPVLFHLMDVSRPKEYSPPPAFSLGGISELPPPAGEREDVDHAPAEPFDLETAAKLVATKAFGTLPAEPVAAPSPVVTDETAATHDEQLPTLGFDEISPAVPEAEAHSDTATAPALETPPPAADDAVSLRDRAIERSRKRQQNKQDDWFRSQGRFIVIGFIAALCVTIYVARTNRWPAAPPVAVKRSAQTSDSKASATKGNAKLPLASGPSVSITNVRPTDKKSSTEPRTALHPPTIPQLARDPGTTTEPAIDTLFTFSKRPEDRLASRTDDINPAITTAPPSASSATALPAGPTLQPQYPTTSYPAGYQPVGPMAAPVPGGGPSATSAGANLTPAASVAPLYPTTNAARGIRNERNGSGLY